jgi:MFS family permease
VLEVFGEHTLDTKAILGLLAIALALIAGYGLHATRAAFPLLRMNLFHLRTFRIAVAGSFVTRLGIGGVPFLLPLLYQVGLGFSPVQSGLLIMPQAIASMTVKILMSRILNRFGYRGVLSSNTIILGLLLFLFASIGLGTPVWFIVLLAFLYGGFTSLQYTSMNTLVYADISDEETSSASSIASTMQQLAISFGVAMAGLVTTLFVPERLRSNAPQMIHGVHLALFILGGMTILSTIVFRNLRPGDGGKVSRRNVPQHPGG